MFTLSPVAEVILHDCVLFRTCMFIRLPALGYGWFLSLYFLGCLQECWRYCFLNRFTLTVYLNTLLHRLSFLMSTWRTWDGRWSPATNVSTGTPWESRITSPAVNRQSPSLSRWSISSRRMPRTSMLGSRQWNKRISSRDPLARWTVKSYQGARWEKHNLCPMYPQFSSTYHCLLFVVFLEK